MSDEELLDLRLCDLDLEIRGTPLEGRVAQLYEELERRNLRFRPPVWLSDEWFVPEHLPGIAVPFYLAHPRLTLLEAQQMYEVEGGDRGWCMRLLRHEAGHAIEAAFHLYHRRGWRELFGRSSRRYPDVYRPNPGSREYVLHLDWWYAQSHPSEDFAETFAVWLTPGRSWRKRYRHWPALHKLEYVDGLMWEIAGCQPVVTLPERIDPLHRIPQTLRSFYRQKRRRYLPRDRGWYDHGLRRLFSSPSKRDGYPAAAAFLRGERQRIRRRLAASDHEKTYVTDMAIKELMKRSRELDLRLARRPSEVRPGLIELTAKVAADFSQPTHVVPL